MLVAAGVCIPAILSLIFTWEKILEINWKRRREPERLDQQIEGVNITVGEMKGINNRVTLFLSVIEIPLFGGAVLVILIIGEINFFSHQLMYQTEPMASIELVQDEPPQEGSNAGRRRVRNWFERAGNKMSDAAHRGLDTSDYSDRRARKYPMIPGEELRNQDLHRTSTQYTHIRDMQAAASYASSIKSARDAENSSTPPTSPQPGANPDAITSAPRRRSTLEVPPVAYHSPKSPQREWGGSG
ncbi:hypothetical protein N0V94_002408 [Neodidymelliopsis sp. IMI 364377]|nr:hypothetical protein N0V94_002408 [Neodidymelliopsis sp. IMI 364377]